MSFKPAVVSREGLFRRCTLAIYERFSCEKQARGHAIWKDPCSVAIVALTHDVATFVHCELTTSRS